MKYKRLRVSFTDAKKRFYRTVYVKPEIKLSDLGNVLCAALYAYNQNFEIRSMRKIFVVPEGRKLPEGKRYENAKKYALSDISKKFEFRYDGDWIFTCSVSPKDYELKENRKAILVGGKGQGIWENAVDTFYAYLEGKVDPKSMEEDRANGITLPENFSDVPYGFFDEPLALTEEKKSFETVVSKLL